MKITLANGWMEAEIQPQDLELEIPCPEKACVLGRNRSGGNCSCCEGRGIVPTTLGLHVLAFVMRNAAWYRQEMKKHPGAIPSVSESAKSK